jgi:hypothetical protein
MSDSEECGTELYAQGTSKRGKGKMQTMDWPCGGLMATSRARTADNFSQARNMTESADREMV